MAPCRINLRLLCASTPLGDHPFVRQHREQWASGAVYTYVALREGADAAQVETLLATHLRTHVPRGKRRWPGNAPPFPLQALTDIHLRSHFHLELGPNGDMMHVYAFSLVAIFILLLACINFVNLSTARSANRAREVGIRKVVGSYRTQLVYQFLFESFVYVTLAMVLALGVCELGLPLLNGLAGKQLTTGSLASPVAVMALACIVVAVAALACAAPLLPNWLPHPPAAPTS